MIFWVLPLLGLIFLPVAGAALDATADTRGAGLRRALSAGAHLTAVACAAFLAAAAGRRPGDPGWDLSSTVLVLFAGAAWVEAVFLSGIRMHNRQPARPGTAATDAGPADAVRVAGADFPAALGSLSAEGEALLLRVLALDSLPVESIMTPRESVAAVDGNLPAVDAVERMRASGHARLPVTVDGSLDRILGVVHAKDLVPFIVDGGVSSSLRRHIRRCLRVPRDQPVARLLGDFRRSRVHFGIVIDPLGRMLGLVTLGDVFAHLAGTRPGGNAGGSVIRPADAGSVPGGGMRVGVGADEFADPADRARTGGPAR